MADVLSRIADELNKAHEAISKIDAGDYTPRKNQILALIQRQATVIQTQIGDDPLDQVAPKFPPLVLRGSSQPGEFFIGTEEGLSNVKPVENNEQQEEEFKHTILLTPLETEANELKEIAIDLYPKFSGIDSKAIKETYSDIEIKAIAKMAGMTVTDDEPKTVTVKFIDSVKAAIKKKADIAAAGNLDKAE